MTAKRTLALWRRRGYPAGVALATLLLLPVEARAQRGWVGPEIPSGISIGIGFPVAAVDDAGAATVAWLEGAGPTYQVRASHRAPGRAWTPAVTLGTPFGGADIAVSAAPSGSVVVLWTAGDAGVYASRYAAHSGTWTQETVVAPRANQYAHRPALAVDGAGHAIALWYLDGVERIEAARYDAASHVWGVVVALGNGVGPLLDMDAAGNAVAAWQDRSGALNVVRAARFASASGVWGAAVTLDSHAFALPLDLDVAADGTAAMLWYAEDSPRTQSALSVALFSPSVGTWGVRAVLSASSPTGVVAVSSHEAMAVWTTGQGAMFSRSDLAAAPGLWSAAAPVDAAVAGPSGLFMSLAADGLGDFVAAWTVGGSGRASHYSRSVTAWEPSLLLNAPGVSVRGPTAVITPAGTATVAWTAEVYPYRAVQASQWDGTLAAPTLQAITPAAGALSVAFAPPTARLPEFAPSNLEYSIDDGSTWTPRVPPSVAFPLAISGLSDDASYAIRLRVVNAAGAGPASNAALARPGLGSTAPSGLRVSDIDGDLVTLTWDPPAVGVFPERYAVEGGVAPGQTQATIATGNALAAFTLRLPPGTFFVRVRAVALAATSGPSNEVVVRLGASAPPSAPAGLLGLLNGSTLALSWTNTFDGGTPSGFWLVVSGPVSGIVPLGLVDTFQYANVPPGTYSFQVVAANAAGPSPPSNAVTLTFPGPCGGPPAAPLRFRAIVDGTTITLRWGAPETGAAATSYRVVVGTFGDRQPGIASGTTDARPAYGFMVPVTGRRISGTLPPDYYNFFLIAENACGLGPMIGPLSVDTR